MFNIYTSAAMGNIWSSCLKAREDAAEAAEAAAIELSYETEQELKRAAIKILETPPITAGVVSSPPNPRSSSPTPKSCQPPRPPERSDVIL